MKRAFISGGAGFIGSHIVRHLLNKFSCNVVIYDNFTSGTMNHVADFVSNDRISLVRGDIKDLEHLVKAMRGCDAVFHTAANPDIAKAAIQPDIDFWEGTYLTSNILEAMRLSGTPLIFYTSGSGVYGDNPNLSFVEEHGPCNPISTYGASKLACEALISSYTHMFGIRGRVFRFANVVGPGQTHGVGYDFLRKLTVNAGSLEILGDGRQLKSYVHVDDVIEAIFLVNRKIPFDRGYTVYNVSTLDCITVEQIANLAIEVLGLEQAKVKKIFLGGDRGWKGDVPIVKFNSSKIRALGWANQYSSVTAMLSSLTSMRKS